MTTEVQETIPVPAVPQSPPAEEYTFTITLPEAKGIVAALQRAAVEEAKLTQALIDKLDGQFSAQFKERVAKAQAEAAATAPTPDAANVNEQAIAKEQVNV